MKPKILKTVVLIILCTLLFSFVSAASGTTTVYITDTGEKYHSYGCQYLRKSCISISLSDAVARGYTRCSKCNPPYLDSTTSSTSGSSYSSGSTSSGSSSGSSSSNNYSSGNSANTSGSSSAGTVSGPGYGKDSAEMKAQLEEYEDQIAAYEEEIQFYEENYISKADADSATEEAVSAAVADGKAKIQKEKTKTIMVSVFVSLLCISIICGIQSNSCNRTVREKDEELGRVRHELESLQNEVSDAKQYNSVREKLIQAFNGQTCRQAANVPDGVVFGNDFFPVKIGTASLVVYISKSGDKYHRYGCRYMDGATAINVFKIPKTCVPCKVCKPQAYSLVPEWVAKYQKYIEAKKQYNIPDPDIPYPNDSNTDS